jgi:hypothetical protein
MEPPKKRAKITIVTPIETEGQKIKNPVPQYDTRYALTLGEQSEIRAGCRIVGQGLAEQGFTVKELQDVQRMFGNSSQSFLLHEKLGKKAGKHPLNEAAVLVIKNGVNLLMKDENYATEMFQEQDRTPYDKFYFDRRRKRNKAKPTLKIINNRP